MWEGSSFSLLPCATCLLPRKGGQLSHSLKLLLTLPLSFTAFYPGCLSFCPALLSQVVPQMACSLEFSGPKEEPKNWSPTATSTQYADRHSTNLIPPPHPPEVLTLGPSRRHPGAVNSLRGTLGMKVIPWMEERGLG